MTGVRKFLKTNHMDETVVNMSKVSLMFTSPEVEFSNLEINFIKKHLHWKYPSAMGGVIDKTRILMREIQKLSQPTQKLTYIAARYHPDNDSRFVVYEYLKTPDEDARLSISIQPIDKERRKEFFEKPRITGHSVLKVIEDLEFAEKTHDFSQTYTDNGCAGQLVIRLIIMYLRSIVGEVTIQNESFTICAATTHPWTFKIDLGHHHSQSHYVNLLIDFNHLNKTASVF